MVIETDAISFTFSPIVSFCVVALPRANGGALMSDNHELAPLDLLRLVPRLEAAKLRLYLVLDLPAPHLPAQTQPAAPKTASRKHAYGVALTRIGRPRAVQTESEPVR